MLPHEKDQDSSERQRRSFLGTAKMGCAGLFVEFTDCSFGFPVDSHKGENIVSSLSDSCVFLFLFC